LGCENGSIVVYQQIEHDDHKSNNDDHNLTKKSNNNSLPNINNHIPNLSSSSSKDPKKSKKNKKQDQEEDQQQDLDLVQFHAHFPCVHSLSITSIQTIKVLLFSSQLLFVILLRSFFLLN